ncbi:hypothetical protein JTB14_012582 [Gonioctena quinquepunctata]|nr:hypothetical protein JTB14_012582 [Gonioctena quinquepunctata]
MLGPKYCLFTLLIIYGCAWSVPAQPLEMTNLLVYLCDFPERANTTLYSKTFTAQKSDKSVEVDVQFPESGKTNNYPITCMIVNALDDSSNCQIISGGLGQTHVSFKLHSSPNENMQVTVDLRTGGPETVATGQT